MSRDREAISMITCGIILVGLGVMLMLFGKDLVVFVSGMCMALGGTMYFIGTGISLVTSRRMRRGTILFSLGVGGLVNAGILFYVLAPPPGISMIFVIGVVALLTALLKGADIVAREEDLQRSG